MVVERLPVVMLVLSVSTSLLRFERLAPNELDLAKKAKFVAVSLGEGRLRTETAGVMVCSIFSTIN